MNKKIIIHIITGLGDGGAEGVLYRLIKHSKSNYTHKVISLMDEGKYGNKLEKLNIQVFCIGFKRGKLNFKGVLKLFKILKNNKSDILQTWMYHSDLLGGLLGYLFGHKNIIWNVRGNGKGLIHKNIYSKIILKLCIYLSHYIPKMIITCSKQAKVNHINFGYKKIFTVIPNGFDHFKFRDDINKRLLIRKKYGVKDNELLLGCIARYSEQKSHKFIINSLKDYLKKKKNIKILFIGYKIKNNNNIINLLKKYNILQYFILLKNQNNIEDIMNSLDLHLLISKYGEGFPNVIAESMLCKIPSITTNVGDSKHIVGNKGWIIEVNSSSQLIRSIDKAIKVKDYYPKLWHQLKSKVRFRIVKKYNIDKMVTNYSNIWNSLK